jgi:ligand-binding sensor domain-containing protein/signal transduction histidine kinase
MGSKEPTIHSKSAPFYLFMARLVVALLWVVFPRLAEGQKFPFYNFSVEQGLVQSQANDLVQDHEGRLWIATMGGLSSFDGLQFRNFTFSDGLACNPSFSLCWDRKNQLWVAHALGLSRYNGKKFDHFPFAKAYKSQELGALLAEDAQGQIWMLQGRQLFRVKKDSLRAAVPQLPKGEEALYLASDAQQQLWVCTRHSGVWTYQKGNWKKFKAADPTFSQGIIYRVFRGQNQAVWLVGTTGLWKWRQGHLQRVDFPGLKQLLEQQIRLLCEHPETGLWMASGTNLYRSKNQQLQQFTLKNGFSDAIVVAMYLDREQNLWFCTSGEGLFRYSGDDYLVYDENSGLLGTSVMSFSEHPGLGLVAGTYLKGLQSLSQYPGVLPQVPGGHPANLRTNALLTDRQKRLWIGIDGNGLWRYQGKTIQKIPLIGEEKQALAILRLYEDRAGRIWVGTNAGIQRWEQGEISQVPGCDFFSSCLLQISPDSMLIGSTEGVRLLVNEHLTKPQQHPILKASAILCAVQRGAELWIGTDNGLFCWNLKRAQFQHFAQNGGLPSSIVYNLIFGPDGALYIGTGKGFCRMRFTKNAGSRYQIEPFGEMRGIPAWENNQNASFLSSDGSLWFGTNRGVLKINPPQVPAVVNYPQVILQDVKTQNQKINNPKWMKSFEGMDEIPVGLRLPARKNHLSFRFTGIHLKNPQGLLYRHRIVGLSEAWSAPSPNREVEYPALPPGKYVFEVQATQKGQNWPTNSMSYAFEIITPFYRTWWFRLALVGALVLLGIGIQAWRNRAREQKLALLAQLRVEEQEKVRRRTAEDFHDEIGNKLTRIALLTDILQRKMPNVDTDLNNLVQQIKDNALQLYAGARDIIWSLNPGSDNLHEVLNRIRDFGQDLFAETDVSFHFEGIEERFRQVSLPMDHSRNLIMICKEALGNTLKHARCSEVNLDFEMLSETHWRMSLKDNGQGFSPFERKKGHGMDNMQRRAARIQADIQFISHPLQGTRIILEWKANKGQLATAEQKVKTFPFQFSTDKNTP